MTKNKWPILKFRRRHYSKYYINAGFSIITIKPAERGYLTISINISILKICAFVLVFVSGQQGMLKKFGHDRLIVEVLHSPNLTRKRNFWEKIQKIFFMDVNSGHLQLSKKLSIINSMQYVYVIYMCNRNSYRAQEAIPTESGFY